MPLQPIVPVAHDLHMTPRKGDVIDANGQLFEHCKTCSNTIMPFRFENDHWRCRVCHTPLSGKVAEISKSAPIEISPTIFQPDEVGKYRQELVGRIYEPVKISQAESRKIVRFFCSSCVRMRTSFRSKTGEVKCPKCKSDIDSKAITPD